jgi:hypothetical protein
MGLASVVGSGRSNEASVGTVSYKRDDGYCCLRKLAQELSVERDKLDTELLRDRHKFAVVGGAC